ncbi:SLATT domain-containing protein [Photobacterium aquimaris]|nr:SLATT domain-containing protein [Photobacterium aquimaris]
MDIALSTAINKLRNQIWFTRKSRIRASERILKNHVHSNSILIWYSFLTFTLSIFLIKKPNYLGDNADVVMTIATGFVFTLSLFVPQLDMKNRYEKLKDNYIQLQGLTFDLDICKTEYQLNIINDKYLKLLMSSENHKNSDLQYFIAFESDAECNRKLKGIEWGEIVLRVIFRWLFFTTAYFLPLLIIFFW